MTQSNDAQPLLVHWRAHHILLCGSTYVGKGYTPEYSEQLNQAMAAINSRPEGVAVKLVDGPDDWCKPLQQGTDKASMGHRQHCTHPATAERDQQAMVGLSVILGRSLQAGNTVHLTPALVLEMRKAFYRATRAKQRDKTGTYKDARTGCNACAWSKLCDEVTLRGFPGVKLLPEAVPRRIIPLVQLGNERPP